MVLQGAINSYPRCKYSSVESFVNQLPTRPNLLNKAVDVPSFLHQMCLNHEENLDNLCVECEAVEGTWFDIEFHLRL